MCERLRYLEELRRWKREKALCPIFTHLAGFVILPHHPHPPHPPPHLPPQLPPLPQAPSSLLEALEQHLASLEGRKLKDLSTASRYDQITEIHWLLPLLYRCIIAAASVEMLTVDKLPTLAVL